jgi:hypothetical protein
LSNTERMTPTGRVMIGPASDLIETEDSDGLKHTSIVFHEEWRQHPAITDALGVIRGFLESPMVTGLVELIGHDAATGSFLYPTGAVWSVAELIRMLSDRGERGGIRAGLELMYTAGQILVEGAEAGEAQGVYSHGGLTPRRIMVKSDGQVMVVGYGLPQVEILQFHVNPNPLPREDSFRYCPPERMEARPEDLSSDLFGLCLIAFELMTGKPVYDGLVKDIRQQAARGEGSRRLFRFREVLPEPVRHVLTKVLRPDQEARYVGGEDFLEDIHTLLSDRGVPGPSLMNLMSELQSEQRRVGESVQAGSTQMVDADQIKAQLTESSGAMGRVSGKPWRPRAGRRPVSRRDEDLGAAEEIDSPSKSAVSSPPAEVAAPVVESAFEAPVSESPAADARWSKVRRPVRRARTNSTEAVVPDAPEPTETPEPPSVLPSAARVAQPDLGVQDPPAPPMVPPLSRKSARAPAVSPISEKLSAASPPVIPGAAASTPTADDLLLAIRGRRAPSSEGHLADQHTAVLPKGEMVEVLLGSESDDESATVMMTPDQLRAKIAQAEADEVAVVDTPSAPPSPPTSSSSKRVKLELVDLDGHVCSVWVPANAGVGAVISSAVGDALVIPADQGGTIEGWYRLELDGQRLPVDRTAGTLTGQRLTVVWVEASTRLVDVAVFASGGDLRFSNPMNTAVPISSLVRHLQGWLAMPKGDWCLMLDGAVLDPHMILDDLDGEGVLAVEFRQRAP